MSGGADGSIATRARVDVFPIMADTPDGKIAELKDHMTAMHNQFSQAIAQVKTKADQHFESMRAEYRGNHLWTKNKMGSHGKPQEVRGCRPS